MAKKRLICNIHDEIMEEVELFDDPDVPYRLRRKVKKILRLAEEAKERGQAMEYRMSDYRSGIEALGFIRFK